MSKLFTVLVFAVVSVFGCAARDLDPPASRKFSGLVPNGWIVEYDTSSSEAIPGSQTYLLVIRDDTLPDSPGQREVLLIAGTNDSLRVVGRSRTILLPANQGMTPNSQASDYVAFEERLVTLSTEWKLGGSSYKFRYDSSKDEFALIGFDQWDPRVHDSRNYLTHKRILTYYEKDKEVRRSIFLKNKSVPLDLIRPDDFEIDLSTISASSKEVPESMNSQ